MLKGKDIRHEGEFFSSTVSREQKALGFWRSRKQISPAHEKVLGGTALQSLFLIKQDLQHVLSCMSPLPWDTFIILSFAKIPLPLKVGALVNQSLEKTTDTQLDYKTL